jgi:hypothetical protein
VFDLSTSATPADINGAAAAVNDASGLASARAALTHDVATAQRRGITADDIQSFNDRHNAIGRAKQQAARGREWGKG